MRRIRKSIKRKLMNDGYHEYHCDFFEDDPNGILLTSQVDNSAGSKMHAPVMDVDAPLFEICESKTPGHQHVFINKKMTWRQYKKIMRTLVKAGVVDKEWWAMCKRRGFGSVLVKPKQPVVIGSWDVYDESIGRRLAT